jgi:uncharacterized membrane protein YidH (DUF202 family)
MSTLVVALGLILAGFGCYGMVRVHQVRPRSTRPELAPQLYVGFAAFIVVGVALVMR